MTPAEDYVTWPVEAITHLLTRVRTLEQVLRVAKTYPPPRKGESGWRHQLERAITDAESVR